MNTTHAPLNMGADLIVRSVNKRKSTADEINFLGQFRKTRQRGAFEGAAHTLINISAELKRAGLLEKITGLSASQRDLLESSREHLFLLFTDLDERDDPRLDDFMETLCMFVDAGSPYITSLSMPTPATTPPIAPLPVQIVSMPSTTAVQTVERNSDDEITRTVIVTKPHADHAKTLQA